MQRENMSRSTFVKGIAATCIAACSLGALSSGEYSTKSGDTYTASAAGIESDVSVTVTVDKSGTIKDVSVDVSGETPGVGADIGDEITQQILDAQSADIDGIAGATITSNAVKTALADALSQAGIDSGLESTTPAQGNAAETAGAESTTEAAESTTEAAAVLPRKALPKLLPLKAPPKPLPLKARPKPLPLLPAPTLREPTPLPRRVWTEMFLLPSPLVMTEPSPVFRLMSAVKPQALALRSATRLPNRSWMPRAPKSTALPAQP